MVAGNHSKPRIEVGDGDLSRMTAEALSALDAANSPVRLVRHGGNPCRIEEDDLGAPSIKLLRESVAKYELADAAVFYKETKDGPKRVIPPDPVVKNVLSIPSIPLPLLTRIIQAPIFSRGGALSCRAGYDAATATYLASNGLEVPDLPECPNRTEINRAIDLLCGDLLGDFPFTSESERAHAIAMLLLPFARELVDGVTPLHLIEKPSPGTGASLMVDVITLIFLGQSAAVMTQAKNEDEMRKRITAILMTGCPMVVLDNLRYRLDSAALSAAITGPVWTDRILGYSRTTTIPNRCVWIATGNNPTLSNEVARRTIRIRLDSKIDRPWLRAGFRHDNLRTWTVAHRNDLVWAALVLIKAWISERRPPGRQPLGMFESWSTVMGGVLDVAGIPGFLANLQEMYEENDDEMHWLRSLMAVWWDEHRDRPIKVGEIHRLSIDKGLNLPIGDGTDRSQMTRLGRLLVQHRDRQVGNRRLSRGDEYQGSYLWSLCELGE